VNENRAEHELMPSELRWPLRKRHEIEAAEDEAFHRLWYYRHSASPHPAGVEAAEKVRGAYPDVRGYAETGDYELGLMEGKLSALRWVLGNDWDWLDT
jgi:hypothetical protein